MAEAVTFIAGTTAYQEEDWNGTPHSGVTIVVSDDEGAQVIQEVTDVDGIAEVDLDTGIYMVSLIKEGVVFTTNNWEITVQNSALLEEGDFVYGDDRQWYQLITTSFIPTVTDTPELPDLCTIEGTIFKMDGFPLRYADVYVNFVSGLDIIDTYAVFDTSSVYRTDSNGKVSFTLVQGVRVEVVIAPLSLRRTITIPADEGPVDLFSLFSGEDDPFDLIEVDLFEAPRRSL